MGASCTRRRMKKVCVAATIAEHGRTLAACTAAGRLGSPHADGTHACCVRAGLVDGRDVCFSVEGVMEVQCGAGTYVWPCVRGLGYMWWWSGAMCALDLICFCFSSTHGCASRT